MNRKLASIAVITALGGAPAALAQSSNVQLYGRANLGIDSYEATGARTQGGVSGDLIDYDARFRVFDNSSRVGLRGTEDLGNGLKAIFQIESGVNMDTGGTSGQGGQGNSSTGTWATRDSFLGLDSRFGRLAFGRQSIWYQNGQIAQFASNYINTEVPWTDGRGMGRMPAPASRQSNVVMYTTPTFSGFNGSLYYSPNAQEAVQHQTSQETDGAIWGVTLRGNFGQFLGQLDYVSNKGNSPIGGGSRSDTEGVKAGLAWRYLPGASVGLTYVWAESNRVLGLTAGDDARQDAWTLNWEHTFGNVQVMAQYGMLGSLKDCDGATLTVDCGGSKADAYMVGARYLLSKRTWVYASWNMVDNEENQFADYRSAGYTSVGASTLTPYGADPQIWALGVFHAF